MGIGKGFLAKTHQKSKSVKLKIDKLDLIKVRKIESFAIENKIKKIRQPQMGRLFAKLISDKNFI